MMRRAIAVRAREAGQTVSESARGPIFSQRNHQVKGPEESRHPWDYYKILKTIPGDEAFRPVSESECPLVANQK